MPKDESKRWIPWLWCSRWFKWGADTETIKSTIPEQIQLVGFRWRVRSLKGSQDVARAVNVVPQYLLSVGGFLAG